MPKETSLQSPRPEPAGYGSLADEAEELVRLVGEGRNLVGPAEGNPFAPDQPVGS